MQRFEVQWSYRLGRIEDPHIIEAADFCRYAALFCFGLKGTERMQQLTPARFPAILIATLGSEPQVVTSALTLLVDQKALIREVHIVHTSQPSGIIKNALNDLQAAPESVLFPPGVTLHYHAIQSVHGEPFVDVDTPEAGEAAFQVLYSLIRHAKQAGTRVHLLIAGGRKTMSIYGMVAAQLLFDDEDQLWHLHSSGEFLASRRLFPQPEDQVQLIPIPVFPWRQASPALGDLRDVEDPLMAVEYYRSLRLDERLAQARTFVQTQLTPAERRVVALLVTEGVSDNELAARLYLSSRTIEYQLRSAFRKAADWWGLPEVNRTTLITLLNLYFILAPGKGEDLGENTDDSRTVTN